MCVVFMLRTLSLKNARAASRRLNSSIKAVAARLGSGMGVSSAMLADWEQKNRSGEKKFSSKKKKCLLLCKKAVNKQCVKNV